MTQTKPTPPKKLVINCPETCSFHPKRIGQQHANALKAARENGAGHRLFWRRAEELLGHPVPTTNVQRHLKHYVEVQDEQDPITEGPRPTDLQILDSIIVSGFRNSRSWKPSIKDTLDAMKLKVQMTGQSAFEDMIAAMNDALDLPDEEEGEDDGEGEAEAGEAPEALLSAGEREHEDTDE